MPLKLLCRACGAPLRAHGSVHRWPEGERLGGSKAVAAPISQLNAYAAWCSPLPDWGIRGKESGSISHDGLGGTAGWDAGVERKGRRCWWGERRREVRRAWPIVRRSLCSSCSSILTHVSLALPSAAAGSILSLSLPLLSLDGGKGERREGKPKKRKRGGGGGGGGGKDEERVFIVLPQARARGNCG